MYFMSRFIVLVSLFVSASFISALAGNEMSLSNEETQGGARRRNPTPHHNLFNSPNYTPEQQELAKQFTQEFTRIFMATLSPHCAPEDRLQMDMSTPRRADKFIERAFNNKPDLKLYAERLPQFITNHYQSKQAELTSIQDLIKEELNGHLPPSSGYAIDFIPENSPLRGQILQNALLLNHMLFRVYSFEETFSKNVVWDFLALDSFNMRFRNNVAQFGFFRNMCKNELSNLLRFSTSLLSSDNNKKIGAVVD